MSDNRSLDDWLKKEYTKLEYLNYIRPLILSKIREFVVGMSKTEEPLVEYRELLKQKPDSKKKNLYFEVLDYLEGLKDRVLTGDKVAKMTLINHGFMRKKVKGGDS